MEALAKLANYKGNVAIMIGNLTDAGALQRTRDVEQVVAKYPAMKVVQKQPANYSRSEGMDLMQNWTGNGKRLILWRRTTTRWRLARRWRWRRARRSC